MKAYPHEFLPLARTERLVIKEVEDEVLVYDLARDQAHCLNWSSATIWRLCDGKRTVAGLAAALEAETGTKSEAGFIWLGLAELRRSHLLEDAVWPEQMISKKGMSRRDAVRRIGIGAAIALPIVMSMAAPTAVQAAVSCGARCKSCSTGSECCSGVCANDPSGCPTGRRCA